MDDRNIQVQIKDRIEAVEFYTQRVEWFKQVRKTISNLRDDTILKRGGSQSLVESDILAKACCEYLDGYVKDCLVVAEMDLYDERCALNKLMNFSE